MISERTTTDMLTAMATIADRARACEDPAALFALRDETVEALELAGDFISLQACEIAEARGEPSARPPGFIRADGPRPARRRKDRIEKFFDRLALLLAGFLLAFLVLSK